MSENVDIMELHTGLGRVLESTSILQSHELNAEGQETEETDAESDLDSELDDLQLSAKVGQMLLKQNEDLRCRLATVERANSELTDILETNLDEVKLLERRCSTMQKHLRAMERASYQRDDMLNDKENEVEILQVEMQKVTTEREFYWKQYLHVKHRLQELEADFYEHKISSAANSRYTPSSDEDEDTELSRVLSRGGGSKQSRMIDPWRPAGAASDSDDFVPVERTEDTAVAASTKEEPQTNGTKIENDSEADSESESVLVVRAPVTTTHAPEKHNAKASSSNSKSDEVDDGGLESDSPSHPSQIALTESNVSHATSKPQLSPGNDVSSPSTPSRSRKTTSSRPRRSTGSRQSRKRTGSLANRTESDADSPLVHPMRDSLRSASTSGASKEMPMGRREAVDVEMKLLEESMTSLGAEAANFADFYEQTFSEELRPGAGDGAGVNGAKGQAVGRALGLYPYKVHKAEFKDGISWHKCVVHAVAHRRSPHMEDLVRPSTGVKRGEIVKSVRQIDGLWIEIEDGRFLPLFKNGVYLFEQVDEPIVSTATKSVRDSSTDPRKRTPTPKTATPSSRADRGQEKSRIAAGVPPKNGAKNVAGKVRTASLTQPPAKATPKLKGLGGVLGAARNSSAVLFNPMLSMIGGNSIAKHSSGLLGSTYFQSLSQTGKHEPKFATIPLRGGKRSTALLQPIATEDPKRKPPSSSSPVVASVSVVSPIADDPDAEFLSVDFD